MTAKRKVDRRESKETSHQSAHRRAMTNPRVRKLVTSLRRQWDSLDPLQRGDRLSELTALGCSRRGLEKDLNQSATSLRRHITLAGLSEPDRQDVAAGTSRKRILAMKAKEDRGAFWQQRVLEEQKTGAPSNEVASMILEFCRGTGDSPRKPVLRSYLDTFLMEVERALAEWTFSGRREAGISNRKIRTERLFRRTRPTKVDDDSFWIAYQAQWLADAIWAKASVRPIWERALEKARNRSAELESKKTAIEVFWGEVQRSAAISQSINRPKFPGAKSMKRQGRPTP